MSKLESRPSPVFQFPDPNEVPGDAPFHIKTKFSAQSLLAAYRIGLYPKPYSERGRMHWYCPDPRTVLFPDEFKAARSLMKSVRNRAYSVTLNQNFASVIHNCAVRRPPRKFTFVVSRKKLRSLEWDWLFELYQAKQVSLDYRDGTMTVEFKSREASFDVLGPVPTWITQRIINAYVELHRQGHAHSVETWQDGRLVGGLYGVSLGSLFCGESMFSIRTDASKVALYHLTRHLRDSGYDLIDCQEQTPLLHSMGAREIPRSDYLEILQRSVDRKISNTVWESLPTARIDRKSGN